MKILEVDNSIHSTINIITTTETKTKQAHNVKRLTGARNKQHIVQRSPSKMRINA